MIEAVKVINVADTKLPSTKAMEDLLFEKYELFDLQ